MRPTAANRKLAPANAVRQLDAGGVMAAFWKDLKPAIDAQRRLIAL